MPLLGACRCARWSACYAELPRMYFIGRWRPLLAFVVRAQQAARRLTFAGFKSLIVRVVGLGLDNREPMLVSLQVWFREIVGGLEEVRHPLARLFRR